MLRGFDIWEEVWSIGLNGVMEWFRWYLKFFILFKSFFNSV